MADLAGDARFQQGGRRWNPWAANPRFDTVAEARRRAQRLLPPSVFKAIDGASQRGITAYENVAAFDDLGFAPHALSAAGPVDLSATVLGRRLALPVLTTPAGVQVMHPEGEVAVAEGAAAVGTAVGVSNFAGKPVEAVVAANDATYSQLYWIGDRSDMAARVDRAQAAGVAGLIVTVDFTFPAGKDCGTPELPNAVTPRTVLRYAPELVRRPRWCWSFARAAYIPDLTVPNLVPVGQPAPGFAQAFRDFMATPPPTWADLAWLRKQWDGPFMIKGISRVDDARRAVDTGCTAISVSNHGGLNVDGTPASIRVLPPIARAVGHEVEVLMDGGIRRGSDVVKALCLGARAVLIGRAFLFGLVVNGAAGVANVLEILRHDMISTLSGLHVTSVEELGPEHLLIPDGFERAT